MAGYWRSSFLFAFLWTETKLRYIKTLKKNEANISHLDQTSFVNKGFIIFAFEGMKWTIDKSILPAQVANQKTEFASSSARPARGASHAIKSGTVSSCSTVFWGSTIFQLSSVYPLFCCAEVGVYRTAQLKPGLIVILSKHF